ncbi:MAG: hypothetical protein AB1631_26655 [Acidobacteriota bacterium]
MKANIIDRDESGSARSRFVETSACNIEEIKDDEEITIRINVEDLIASAPAAIGQEEAARSEAVDQSR